MRSRIINLACLILITVSACRAQQSAPAPLATPTTFYLVTVPADATPTLTPFQPLTDAVLPPESTPQSLYNPPYTPTPASVLNDNQAVTFILLGSDKRPGQTHFRTDTIVIAVLRPASGQVALISVPRDLYVYIPTVGMDRINAAYEYGDIYHYPGGGFALLKDTILENLGLRIDHLAIVDFDGFRRIVNTLGGVDVNVSQTFYDARTGYPNGYTVYPGIVHMNGDLALWYARSRKTSSDFDRGRRSQEVLRALYTRALQTGSISKIPELYNDFSSSIITDLMLSDLLQLTPLALHLNNADIRSYYINRDLVTSWMTPGGASVLLPNGPAIQSMLQLALSPAPAP
jgi:polyisoprenyl-teichoic acid--peptidoglycan teichoic acid transferase